jgi:hypothetical protein
MPTTPVNPEAGALADLQAAISTIGTAIAAEVTALQNAMNAQGVNNTPAIEASVQNIKNLTATLNNSLAAPPPPPPVTGPVVTSIAPAAGPIAGGTSVTVTGTGLTGATGVTVAGTPGNALVVASDTSLTFTTPPSAAGPAVVVVTTPAGVSGPGTTFTYS